MQKLLQLFRSRKGFTMVELLVVISIIGILAAAIIAVLNPAEQLRKGRDTARNADTASLLNALDRYAATFGCYPWEYDSTNSTCDEAGNDVAAAAISSANFATGGNMEALVSTDELKSQFQTRNSITNSELKIFETAGQASVCFTPESQTARAGGLGPIVTNTNTSTGATCGASYDVTDANCNVCVPR